MQVNMVKTNRNENTKEITSEEISLQCVCGNQPFGPNGESEDNTFARWSPSGSLKLFYTNPNLFGTVKEGQKFYVDLVPAKD